MKMMNTMLIVDDIDKSIEFYKKTLNLEVELDFGANKTLTGGLVLQTLDTYKEFIKTDKITFGGNDVEIYFEEDNFDVFVDVLAAHERIEKDVCKHCNYKPIGTQIACVRTDCKVLYEWHYATSKNHDHEET